MGGICFMGFAGMGVLGWACRAVSHGHVHWVKFPGWGFLGRIVSFEFAGVGLLGGFLLDLVSWVRIAGSILESWILLKYTCPDCWVGGLLAVWMGLTVIPDPVTKKFQACKHCLWTIFEKIVDIFGFTSSFWHFFPINDHKSPLLSTISPFLLDRLWFSASLYALNSHIS